MLPVRHSKNKGVSHRVEQLFTKKCYSHKIIRNSTIKKKADCVKPNVGKTNTNL